MTKKHEHIGIIVDNKILTRDFSNLKNEVLFLYDTDIISKKNSIYGPFEKLKELKEFAAFHNIKIKYDT